MRQGLSRFLHPSIQKSGSISCGLVRSHQRTCSDGLLACFLCRIFCSDGKLVLAATRASTSLAPPVSGIAFLRFRKIVIMIIGTLETNHDDSHHSKRYKPNQHRGGTETRNLGTECREKRTRLGNEQEHNRVKLVSRI